jgi:RNA polymerase sigma factor (TIGR02999 family)
MTGANDGRVTRLLHDVGGGCEEARQQLWQIVYDELRRMAHNEAAAEPAGPHLQTTALVHEAYVRLLDTDGRHAAWDNRRHFFGAAAEAMRRILVDDARRRKRLKRGGGRIELPLEEEPACSTQDPADLLAIDEALAKLESRAPRQAEVVKLRYFVGMTVDEAASAMGVSPRTVDFDWRLARAWLHRELAGSDLP